MGNTVRDILAFTGHFLTIAHNDVIAFSRLNRDSFVVGGKTVSEFVNHRHYRFSGDMPET